MSQMKVIIEWLLNVEKLADEVYRKVSERGKEDAVMSDFFFHLANEEVWHGQIMQNALEYMEGNVQFPSPIIVDDATKEKIESVFVKHRELLEAGRFSRAQALECLSLTEFSEWNDIFIYVVSALKEERQFMQVAAKMHRHVKEIENYLQAQPEGQQYLQLIRNLPPLWKESMLIIDDDAPLAHFLTRLFSDDAQIETASNGSEGLEKVKEKYFDVIISDMQMPVMDGMEFYRRAAAHDPLIGQRTLFFTGSTQPKVVEFFEKNGLRYLMKPAGIREIVKKVAEIMPDVDKER